ncbi:hypothetical protein DW708_00590 [Ruminococcus sp. AM27-11LB]|jgi:ABC-type phosphate transport system substrate-binding protein|uniref:hypothetical protein n=1 Tax=Mediterraneibacter TaxID=2316020 RepID=UPI000E4BD29F|nr:MULTISPECIES: hypothetical protein [Mediterraneibacter]RGH95567.1 hypothetical protein DW719_00590 [Ruminococcus sp. AM27-27]RGH97811.1 hypothetical protein DW708_00590 [Ruminococcus sp. AM27-11LB]
MQIKKEWNNTRKSLLKIFFMLLVLVCICTLSVPRKSLAQEITDSATYAGSTSVKAYVTGNSENEQENHPEDEEHLHDESTTNAKTGDESNARIWIVISIFSMIVFGCGVKYKKVTSK